ncbi:hypothetical protein KFE25_013073 [Diacronema lutheri]|uniref:RNA helicase n=1 Tax=Diacronema lutheri TaxID=2081491 RepID=A0A8J5XER2_DIALT|nr:hypothetical protein KFE25_013073 [Diacronema lutheri]
MAENNELNDDELVDYDDEGEALEGVGNVAAGGDVKKGGTYSGIHQSGFRDFLLKPELLRAVVDCGFEHPSEVQHECIPQAILGMDVICQAKSGMGKTAVFVLAVLHQIEPKDGETSVLVMCHTRELAFQIHNEFTRFSRYLPDVKSRVFYGGVPVSEHKAILKSDPPHVIVGTPGRVLQLSRDKDLPLGKVKHFVLDECDKMLEQLDMRKDVQDIFKMTPHEKQVMMFSATLSKEMRAVCKRFMQDPMEIYVDDCKLTLHGLQQHYVKLSEAEKNRKLNDLLDALEFNQVVIFVKSIGRATELNKLLTECNFPSIAIHRGMPQEARIQKYEAFKNFQHRILVSTDIWGRGIDIERVNIVINYDMPDASDSYLHRVGRAGRFGTKGLAITFASSEEDAKVLEDVQARFEVSISPLPDTIDVSSYMTA